MLSSTASRVLLVPTSPLVPSTLSHSMLTPSSYEHGLVDLENPKWEGEHQESNDTSLESDFKFRDIVNYMSLSVKANDTATQTMTFCNCIMYQS